jgi:Flp pilus assembly protein TadG
MGAHRTRPRRTDDDRGQALPLLAGALALVVMLMLGLVALGTTVDDRARAQTAADAAALAGAADGRVAAEGAAAANHASLERFTSQDGEVEVVVRAGGSRATARAGRSW